MKRISAINLFIALIASILEIQTRQTVQAKWNEAIAKSGCKVASVTIINEVDDEEFPPSVSHDFKYLEAKFKL